MTNKYQFDALRFCRNNKGRMGKLPDGSDTMERIAARLVEVEAQRDMLRGYMETLSCLGNGEKPGNSIGNTIAQEALAKLEAHDG